MSNTEMFIRSIRPFGEKHLKLHDFWYASNFEQSTSLKFKASFQKRTGSCFVRQVRVKITVFYRGYLSAITLQIFIDLIWEFSILKTIRVEIIYTDMYYYEIIRIIVVRYNFSQYEVYHEDRSVCKEH